MSASTTAARILSAQMRLCEELAATRKAACAANASASTIADLEAQEQAARRRYQELAIDMPTAGHGQGVGSPAKRLRPWWRFW